MKRYSGLHDKLCTIENIEVADDNARKNKNKKYGINKHDKNRQYENEDLVDKLFNLKYKTSKYSLYKIYEPKERIIYRLPYYPDRIAHHAIMNMDGLNTLMLKIFFIKFKVLQVLDILIGMVKELILLNIMVNMLE